MPRIGPPSPIATPTTTATPPVVDLARKLHFAVVGARWDEAQALATQLRTALPKGEAGLDERQRLEVKTRLDAARAGAAKADEKGAMGIAKGVLGLGIPLLVDAVTTNGPERVQRAIDGLDVAAPVKPGLPKLETPVVDLHADTAMHGLDLGDAHDRSFFHRVLGKVMPDSTRGVTLEAFKKQGTPGLQVMTVYEEGLPPFARGSHKLFTQHIANGLPHGNDTPLNQFVAQLAFIHGQVEKYGDSLALTGPGSPMAPGRQAIQLSTEGARAVSVGEKDLAALKTFLEANRDMLPKGLPIPTDAELASPEGRLDYFARAGVASMGIVHMGANDFAGTDVPGLKQLTALRRGDNGLTEAGRALVKGMDARGILVDLAHASKQTQTQVAEMWRAGELKRPVIVSHGTLDTDGDPHWRDTPPETLALVRDSGGVFGVMLSERYWDQGLAGVRGAADQIEKAVQLAGVEHVALGSDADGFVSLVVPDLGGVGAIADELGRRGWSEDDVAKVFWKNAARTLAARDD